MCEVFTFIPKLLTGLCVAGAAAAFWIGMLMYLDGYFEPERVLARRKEREKLKHKPTKASKEREREIINSELYDYLKR